MNVLKRALDNYFEQIEETLDLVFGGLIDDFPWNVTIGRYMKELALLSCERESPPIISKCIEEIRQELEKYDCIRSASQSIDEFITKMKKKKKNSSITKRNKCRKAKMLRATRRN